MVNRPDFLHQAKVNHLMLGIGLKGRSAKLMWPSAFKQQTHKLAAFHVILAARLRVDGRAKKCHRAGNRLRPKEAMKLQDGGGLSHDPLLKSIDQPKVWKTSERLRSGLACVTKSTEMRWFLCGPHSRNHEE
eukprot:1454278-Amphidinium_carterae.1